MQVVVTDLQHVAVDGIEAGSVTDVLENYRGAEGVRSAVLTALEAWVESLRTAHTAELAAQSQSLTDAHAAELAAVIAKHEAECAECARCHEAECCSLKEGHASALDAACKNHAAECVTLRQRSVALEKTVREQDAMITALGGVSVGKRLANEARAAKLLEDKAKIDAELATLAPNEATA